MKIEDLKNYEIKQHRFLHDINTDAYVLSHKKTGARVVVMPNDEENKVFYIGFRTPPKDSTGVAHIVEHTVLCGSDKYPIKDPFVELCKGSLNTFLNAMTYPDKTVYPVASCNDFDFKNLMDVYLDAVFHPNIYKEENIFRQEGWHYELENKDDELNINGVVYSEMKGAFSDPDDIVERQIMNSIFPDTPYGVESGGDPDVIPSLTYSDFLDFHSKYYHPSNSYIFLYGNCDMAERLDYIDKEYLSNYEKIEVSSEISTQEAFDKRRDVVIEYPLTENEDDKDKTYLNLTYCFSDYRDRELPIVLRAFEYAFSGNPAAPLRKALLDAGIGNEIYASSDCSIKQNLFGFYAKGANPEDKDKFLDIIQKEIERTVKEGFDKKTILAFLVREEFKYREADFGRIPKGLTYGLDMLESWLYDDTLALHHMECLDIYKKLKEAVETDYFEKLTKNSSKGEKNSIKKQMKDSWDGSCYGIAMSMGLLYEGYISLADLTDSKKSNYFTLNYPYKDKKFLNMINYYQLSQHLENGGKQSAAVSASFNNGIFTGLTNWINGYDSLPVFLKKLVKYCDNNHVELMGYSTSKSGHAVLITGCEFDSSLRLGS